MVRKTFGYDEIGSMIRDALLLIEMKLQNDFKGISIPIISVKELIAVLKQPAYYFRSQMDEWEHDIDFETLAWILEQIEEEYPASQNRALHCKALISFLESKDFKDFTFEPKHGLVRVTE